MHASDSTTTTTTTTNLHAVPDVRTCSLGRSFSPRPLHHPIPTDPARKRLFCVTHHHRKAERLGPVDNQLGPRTELIHFAPTSEITSFLPIGPRSFGVQAARSASTRTTQGHPDGPLSQTCSWTKIAFCLYPHGPNGLAWFVLGMLILAGQPDNHLESGRACEKTMTSIG